MLQAAEWRYCPRFDDPAANSVMAHRIKARRAKLSADATTISTATESSSGADASVAEAES